jgi:hypothetical protein
MLIGTGTMHYYAAWVRRVHLKVEPKHVQPGFEAANGQNKFVVLKQDSKAT